MRLASIRDVLQQLCSAEGLPGPVAAPAAAGPQLPAAASAAPALAPPPQPPAPQLTAEDDEDEEVCSCDLRPQTRYTCCHLASPLHLARGRSMLGAPPQVRHHSLLLLRPLLTPVQ